MIKEGDKAIDFSLKDKDGKKHSLKDFKSRFLVLYFYPKDNTPGCTIEAKMFSKDIEKYKKASADIIGISGGDDKSKKKFCERNNLKIPLLSDTDFIIPKKYGVYGEKNFMGKKYMGINRTTFIIRNNKIIKIFEKVNPKNHSDEVLGFLKVAA